MIDKKTREHLMSLTKEQQQRVLERVGIEIMDALKLLSLSIGKENAKTTYKNMMNDEMEKALENESYEYCDIINRINKIVYNAID